MLIYSHLFMKLASAFDQIPRMKSMFAVLSLGVASLGAVAAAAPASDAATLLQFRQFVSDFKKSYATEKEFNARLAIFRDNLNSMERHRQENPQATFGVNKFADLTREEFKGYKGYHPTTPQADLPLPHLLEGMPALVPPEIDWRKKRAVSAVYDQGQCGCCWAISVTETIESQWFLHNKSAKVPKLSFQQLICCDCKHGDQGCNGGDPHTAYNYIERAGGLNTYEEYPFTDGGQPMPWESRCNSLSDAYSCNQCKFNSRQVAANITGYVNVTTTSNETALAVAVADVGPISVCVDSEPWQTYTGGVLSKCGRQKDHCVQVVGYNTNKLPHYWVVKNSWGLDWGLAGYIHIGMGEDLCGIADVPTYPLV